MRKLLTILMALVSAAGLAAEPLVDVPFRYVKNTILLDHVSINGHGDYTFLVDTGSTACTVTTEVADALGLPRGGWSDVSAIGANRKLRIARVQSIAVGSAKVESPLTLIADDNGLSKHVGCAVNGVLGTPFLWKGPVQVDYPNQRLRIFPHEHDLCLEPVEAPWSSVAPLTIRKRAAYVQVAINGARPHEMMLDTGATGIVVSEERAKEAKAAAAAWHSTSMSAFGPRRDSAYWRLDKVRIAGLNVENAQAFTPKDIGDWKSDQLGNDALDQFRLTIDTSRRMFRLERDVMPERFDDSAWGVGIAVRRDHDAVRVAEVRPGGDAANLGLAPGDTLLAVDQQDVGGFAPEGLRDLLIQPPGYTVALQVRTPQGVERSVQVKSQRYMRKRPSDAIATSVSVVQPR